MKKILFLFLFSPLCLCALYNGNPASPEIIEEGPFFSGENVVALKLGYQGDYVFRRELRPNGHPQGDIDHFTYWVNQGVVTLDFFDLLEAYADFGAIKASFKEEAPQSSRQEKRHTDVHFSWGGGARGELFRWSDFVLGLNGDYLASHLHVKGSGRLYYREWQAGLSLAWHKRLCVPYVGIKYSNLTAHRRHLPSSPSYKMQADHAVGLLAGLTLSNSQWVDLTLEGRVIDEEALTLAGNFKF